MVLNESLLEQRTQCLYKGGVGAARVWEKIKYEHFKQITCYNAIASHFPSNAQMNLKPVLFNLSLRVLSFHGKFPGEKGTTGLFIYDWNKNTSMAWITTKKLSQSEDESEGEKESQLNYECAFERFAPPVSHAKNSIKIAYCEWERKMMMI